jgi:hypothetical protein
MPGEDVVIRTAIILQWQWIAVGLGTGIAIGWVLGWLSSLAFTGSSSRGGHREEPRGE